MTAEVGTNIKAKKNFLCPEWPNYMTNKFTFQYKPYPQPPGPRPINTNSKFGLSCDNPVREQSPYSVIFYQSASIYGLNPNKSPAKDSKEAGLSYTNKQSKFHCWNGKEDVPKVFLNYID